VRSKGGNNSEIENFGIYPARLTNIKVGGNSASKQHAPTGMMFIARQCA
jgi:hypothetical protein